MATTFMQVGGYLLKRRQQGDLTGRHSAPEALLDVLLRAVRTQMPDAVQQCVPGGPRLLPKDHPHMLQRRAVCKVFPREGCTVPVHKSWISLGCSSS